MAFRTNFYTWWCSLCIEAPFGNCETKDALKVNNFHPKAVMVSVVEGKIIWKMSNENFFKLAGGSSYLECELQTEGLSYSGFELQRV